MIQKLKDKRSLLIFGTLAAIMLLVVGLFFSNNRADALTNTIAKDEEVHLPTKLNDDKEEEEKGKSNFSDFKSRIDELLKEIEEEIANFVPEGYEGNGTFFSTGDTIARNTGEGWEYSNDGGQTWSDKAPEGFETDDSGFRYRNDNENTENNETGQIN
ncbi:MAG: hypothetical protein ACK5LC_16425 [Coprobacillaceae bacterium]